MFIFLNTRERGTASAAPERIIIGLLIAVFLCSSVAPAARARSLASPTDAAIPNPAVVTTPAVIAETPTTGAARATAVPAVPNPIAEPRALPIP